MVVPLLSARHAATISAKDVRCSVRVPGGDEISLPLSRRYFCTVVRFPTAILVYRSRESTRPPFASQHQRVRLRTITPREKTFYCGQRKRRCATTEEASWWSIRS